MILDRQGKKMSAKKKLYIGILVCLIVIIIGLGWYLISIFVQDRQSEENYDALATATLTEAEATEKTMTEPSVSQSEILSETDAPEIVIEAATVTSASTTVISADDETSAQTTKVQNNSAAQPTTTKPTAAVTAATAPSYGTEIEKVIGFDALQEINPDIYAWITVPGTKINYPVVMVRKGDTYYLEHDAEGNADRNGAIYAEDWNSKFFTDRLTFLYGHNMANGSMFAGVHAFRDAKFFDEHDSVYIYQGNYRYKYKIVACYTASDEHLLALYDFSSDDVWQDYLDGLADIKDISANFRDIDELELDDKILTLSTCASNQQNKRIFLQAVLETKTKCK